MRTVTNPLQACNDIFFRPNGVFRAIGEKNNWSWLPFLIVVIVTILPQYFYYQTVDFDWYVDLLVDAQYADKSPAEQEAFRNSMTPTAAISFAAVGVFLAYIVINAIIAVYLNLATRSDEHNVHGFTDWYGFTWWLAMPIVVNCLVAMLLILFADGSQISPTIMAPLSAAYILNVDVNSTWYSFAQAIRLDSFWTIYLTIVGVSQWTSFSGKKATIIAVAPYVVIWGIWLVLGLMQ